MRRIFRMWQIFGLTAGDAAVATVFDVKVKMIGVGRVIAWAEDGGEVLTPASADIVQQTLFAEAEPARLAHVDILSVAQFDAHHVKRIAL